MNTARFALPIAAACLLVAPGCEDPGSLEHSAIQQDLVDAAARLHQVNVASAELDESTLADVRRDLTQVVSSLNGIRGGADGQQAARSLMLSTALRDLASLDLEQAQMMEADDWRDLAVAQAKVDVARRLHARAVGMQEVSIDREQDQLRRDREQATDAVRNSAGELSTIEEPIQTLTRENAADSAEIEQLDTQANQLRRAAAEQGSAGGFQNFEQAVGVERRADRLRYDVAQREIDLGYDLQPRHDYWSSRRQQAQTMIERIDETLADLEQTLARYDASADTARQGARRLLGEVTATLQEVQKLRADSLDPLYEEAADRLEKAANHAAQAAAKMGRDGGAAAQLAAARAHESRGRALAAQAQGLAAEQALAVRLGSLSELVDNASSFQAQARELATRHEAVIEQAKAAYTAARDQLERVQSRDARSEVEAFKSSVAAALTSLEGRAATPSAPTLSLSGSNPASSAPPAGGSSGGAGFASPEDLVSFINGISEGGLDAQLRFFDAIHAESEGARDLVDLMRMTAEPSARFAEALAAQFGEEAVQQMASGGSGMNIDAFQSATIQSRGQDQVTVAVSVPGQPGRTFTLIPVGSAWMIDGDTLFPEFSNMPAPARHMARQGAMGAVQAYDGLIQRLQDGEFSSPAEVMQAMMQEMMRSAGGGAGAPGGMPPNK